MKRTIKRIQAYTYPHNGGRNRLTTNLMLKAIRKVLADKDNAQIEEQERSETNKPKYWEKWTDPLVIVTVILAIATFALYWEATRQSGISNKAAQAAITADSLTQIAITRDSSRYIQSSLTDSARFERQYGLSYKSLRTQIGTITTTQKDFEIENEPYLQVMQPSIETFIVGQPITLTYFFVNLGKYPAKILTLDVGGKANTYPPNVEDSNTFKFDKPFPDFINTFIIKESPLSLDHPAVDEIPLTQSKYQGVISHTYNYYLYGRIQYQNLANHKNKIYSFLVQLDPITKAAHYLYNDNKETTPSQNKQMQPPIKNVKPN